MISTEVALLEQRLRSGAGDPQQVAQSASRLKTTIPTAAAVGDLAALERCDTIVLVGGRVSSGMAIERDHAVKCGLRVYDLTAISVEPPTSRVAEAFAQEVVEVLAGSGAEGAA